MKYQQNEPKEEKKKKPLIKDRTVPKLHLVICSKFQNDCIRNLIFSQCGNPLIFFMMTSVRVASVCPRFGMSV